MAYVKAIQFFKLLLFTLCFFLLSFCILSDFRRFMNKEDSSSISFRKFNFSPKDEYPTITICIAEGYDAKPIFVEQRFQDFGYHDIFRISRPFGNSVWDYWNKINGINATTEDIKKLPEFSNVTIPFEDLIVGKANIMEFDSYESFHLYDKNSDNVTFSKKDFYLSHQDSTQICYSMTSEFKQNQLKFAEYILLGDTRFGSNLGNGIWNVPDGLLRVYLHYKGQTVRNLGKEIFRFRIKALRDRTVSIDLVSFSVLRRRLDAKIPCNPNYQEDDDMFRSYVIEKVKCIPPYWKIFYQQSTDLKSCDTPKQLKEASWYNKDRNRYKVFDHLKPPCSEITATATINTDSQRGMIARTSIVFFYGEYRYQEIRNLPDFEFNSLWLSIGGFVGIFLGISVFQIGEKALEIVNKLVLATKTY